jgi:rare lipoprotein A
VARRRRVALLVVGLIALVAGVVVGAGGGAPTTPERLRVALASTFGGPGQPLACGGRLAVGEIGVAHRSLPCGATVYIRYGGRSVHAKVIDRGPFVAGRELDLTSATADALRFPGLARVAWARVP